MRRSSIEGILEYLLILLIILDTNSIYSASVEIDYHIPEITAIVLVILMVYRCSRPFNRININRLGIFLIVYYPYIILYGLASVRGEQTLSFVARFVIVLPSLIVYFCMQTQLEYVKLFQKYINVMTVLASISLFFLGFWISNASDFSDKRYDY